MFARRERGSFWIPLLVVTVLICALFYLNSGALQPVFDAEFDRGVAVRDNPKIPPEAVERMRGIASRVGQVFMVVFMPIAIFGVGAKQTFRAAFVVAAYAHVPRILESVVHGLQGLLLDPAQLDGRFRLSLGPGRFLDPDTVSPRLLALVGRMDVFPIWITVLIAIDLVGDRPHSPQACRGCCCDCLESSAVCP